MVARTVTVQIIVPKYKRDNGVLVLDLDNIPLPNDLVVRERSLVRLPAGQIAGNHKHPRTEAYVCLEEGAELHWIDDEGNIQVEQMQQTDGDPRLFIIPPLVPHAISNSSAHDITLLGYADGPLEDVQAVEIVKAKG